MTDPAPIVTLARPAVVLLSEEACVRGFKRADGTANKTSFRRWCVRVGVKIHKTGRKEWVATADVDRAALGPAPTTPANDLQSLASASVARTMKRR